VIGPQFPEEPPPPVTRSTLLSFAALGVALGGGLAAWSAYHHGGRPTATAWVALACAALVGLPGLVHPPAIRPVYLALRALTRPVGHVTSTVLMALIYYSLLTPLALLFRLGGRDALARRPSAATSDWAPKLQPTDVRRYLRQYQRQQGAARRSEGA
jgi:hypothetical protein